MSKRPIIGVTTQTLQAINGIPTGLPQSDVMNQRYYEAVRSSLPTLVTMVNEAINNGLLSIEKRLEEHASHKHALIS